MSIVVRALITQLLMLERFLPIRSGVCLPWRVGERKPLCGEGCGIAVVRSSGPGLSEVTRRDFLDLTFGGEKKGAALSARLEAVYAGRGGISTGL